MAYRNAVKYIEEMNPAFVKAVGDECLRSKGIIKSALPTLARLPGKVDWRSDASDLYEKRLGEAIDLVEGLYDGFEKAGAAIVDYAEAQVKAKRRLADGIAAEKSLGSLIASVAATQSLTVRFTDPLSQWHDLRSLTSPTDLVAEWGQRDNIDKIRPQAEALWEIATTAYDDAIRLETQARKDALPRLKAAYEMLPDFLANSKLGGEIVDRTPGLEDTGKHKYRIGPPTVPTLESNSGFSFDPNAKPTAGDYVSWNQWQAALKLARVFRPDLDDGLAAYIHFRGNTGTDLWVDYEEAYSEDAKVRRTVDTEITSAQREAERLYRETGQTGFQMTGEATTAKKLINDEYPTSTENWQKALGGYQVYGTSDVVVNGDQMTMKIKVHAEDVYNFNPGEADKGSGREDAENGRFSTLGWAKEFRAYGELERTVTWTIGDPGDAQVSGGRGPDRNAPGEDRTDGWKNG